MNIKPDKPLRIFAPAKVNLYLHITGKRGNGYHELDSLVSFTDIGDTIHIENSDQLSFSTCGPFGQAFSASDIETLPHSPNLVIRAVWALARLADINPSVKIRLEKNLPLASGIGGGSADAAATIWGLCEFWNLPRNLPGLKDALVELGADVPVCYTCETARISGIGEIIEPCPELPEIPIVLVNPAKPCPTKDVFRIYSGAYRKQILLPRQHNDITGFIDFLNAQSNDLENAARKIVPEIGNALNALSSDEDCLLARLSGSGATCFGLFETPTQAQNAARKIAADNPDWWVEDGLINHPGRY